MRVAPILVLVPLFAACPLGGDVDRGALQLCVDGDATVVDGGRVWEIAGTVISDELGNACGSGVGQLLTLEQGDGTRRVFGYADTSVLANGEARGTGSVTIGSQVGAAVTLKLVSTDGWAMDMAFELRDDAGHLLAAGAEGYDTTLDLPELAVAAGEAAGGRATNDCGTMNARMLRLSSPVGAWSDVEVAPGEAQLVDLATATDDPWSAEVMNLGAWAFEGDVRCTDTWGPTPWFAVGAAVFLQL